MKKLILILSLFAATVSYADPVIPCEDEDKFYDVVPESDQQEDSQEPVIIRSIICPN